MSARLDEATLTAWGGAVVVENHVNVLRATVAEPVVTAETSTRLFGTETLDRVLRCLSGSVAVSAYELAAVPLPGQDVLDELAGLEGAEFERRVALAYCPASS